MISQEEIYLIDQFSNQISQAYQSPLLLEFYQERILITGIIAIDHQHFVIFYPLTFWKPQWLGTCKDLLFWLLWYSTCVLWLKSLISAQIFILWLWPTIKSILSCLEEVHELIQALYNAASAIPFRTALIFQSLFWSMIMIQLLPSVLWMKVRFYSGIISLFLVQISFYWSFGFSNLSLAEINFLLILTIIYLLIYSLVWCFVP